METNVDGIVATERYGSAESWKYVVQDGVMQRRKDGSSSFSLVGAFKVRILFIQRGFILPDSHGKCAFFAECFSASGLS